MRSRRGFARNPRGTIPVLTHGGDVVHETFAILRHAEWLAPGHIPEDRAGRATAMTRLFEAEHLKAVGMKALAYIMATPSGDRDPEVLRAHAGEVAAELDRWEGYLVEGGVAGPMATLADFVVHAYVDTLFHLGMSLARWPRIAIHRERMSALEAFQVTQPPAWHERAADSPWPSPPVTDSCSSGS